MPNVRTLTPVLDSLHSYADNPSPKQYRRQQSLNTRYLMKRYESGRVREDAGFRLQGLPDSYDPAIMESSRVIGLQVL